MPVWNAKLAYLITPKSGPVRAMDTLLDANHAITQDLPVGWLRRPHWGAAGKLLLAAAERGEPEDIAAVTDALLAAIEHEGWMERVPLSARRQDSQRDCT
jgi:hypothetical protein